MDTRILFTDLDGTLLNDEKEVTAGNHAAIDEALAHGHKIVISTGRPLVSAKMQAERIGLTREGCYAITYNGSQIYDMYHQKTVYGHAIPVALAAPLFHKAAEMNLHIQTYSSTHILSEYENEDLHMYARINQIPFRIVDDITAALEGDPFKLIAVSRDAHDKLLRFQEYVSRTYPDILDTFFSNDMYLEIVPIGISKGFAVKWLCEYLGIPLENSVAAGDAQNDIAMLKAAHVGAVMCNAFPGIAEHGNYITKADNNHDGVAEIIHKFILCDQ